MKYCGMQQSLEVGNIGLEEHKSFDVFSTEASLLSEHVSPTICIRYGDAIRPNTNRLFRPLFDTKVNTN